MISKPYLSQVCFRPEMERDVSAYPFSIPAVQVLEKIRFHPDVTFLVGENGSGKSTVLEALALALGFGPEGGTRNVRIDSSQSASRLHESLRLVRSFSRPGDGFYLRAESFYNVATYMGTLDYLGGYGGGSLHSCSHGEAFMKVLLHKLQGHGLYLLDDRRRLYPLRVSLRRCVRWTSWCRRIPNLSSRHIRRF